MKSKITSKESIEKVMKFFTSLSDETRLKILLSLTDGAKNVNEIYSFLGTDKMTLSAVSHQLKMLSDLEMVSYERKGKEKFFSLSENFCWCILKDAFSHSHKGSECEACRKLKGKKMGGIQ